MEKQTTIDVGQIDYSNMKREQLLAEMSTNRDRIKEIQAKNKEIVQELLEREETFSQTSGGYKYEIKESEDLIFKASKEDK